MKEQVQPSKRRVHRYLVFRFAVILMAIGLATIYQMGLDAEQKEPALRFLNNVIGVYTLIGLLSLLAVRRLAVGRGFVGAQVGLDFIMGALMAGATGGVVSVFCPLLFVSLFSACSVVSWRGAVIFAALATTFLAIMTLGQVLELIPLSSNRLRWLFHHNQLRFIATYLVAMGVAFHLVAILGSRVTAGLVRIQSLQTEIVQNMGDGLVAVDLSSKILEMNGEARKLFEMPEDMNPVGLDIDEVIKSVKISSLLTNGDMEGRVRCEDRVTLRSGKQRHFEVKLSSIPDERGRCRCWILLFNDLALKNEVEQAERKIQQLEHLYEMSLGISHEIRNPLACIRGCMQEIGRLGDDNPDCKPLVDIVCRESDRLDGIIEDFMSYVRKSPSPSTAANLVDTIDSSVALLKNHPESVGREILWRRSDEPFWILGDHERLQQVFLNLGLNALDSTRDGDGLIELSVRRIYDSFASSREPSTSGVVVEVRDNGVGIPKGAVEKVFTPFFTSKERGIGLGLSIVHQIVREHRGTIRVQSQPGETCFTLWFPEEVDLGKQRTLLTGEGNKSAQDVVERDCVS